MLCLEKLQSLFTWIFYLFFKSASLLAFFLGCFNPYSPGFSIYFKTRSFLMFETLSFNPYSPGFSIYFKNTKILNLDFRDASILIHLDFLSIYRNCEDILEAVKRFNPYSPGFSIYFIKERGLELRKKELQSLFTWIFYLF